METQIIDWLKGIVAHADRFDAKTLELANERVRQGKRVIFDEDDTYYDSFTGDEVHEDDASHETWEHYDNIADEAREIVGWAPEPADDVSWFLHETTEIAPESARAWLQERGYL